MTTVIVQRDIEGLAAQLATTLAQAQAYADGLFQSADTKNPVRVVATANVTLSGAQTIDGVSLTTGDRVLLTGQTTASQNGWYNVQPGAWTRTVDADSSGDMIPGAVCWVNEGTSHADSLWELKTNAPITLGTTSLVFEEKLGGAANVATFTENMNVVGAAGATYSLPDVNLYTVNFLNLNANLTLSPPPSPDASHSKTVFVFLKQDATGGRTLTLASNIKTNGGSGIVLSTGANKLDAVALTSYDATNWLMVPVAFAIG